MEDSLEILRHSTSHLLAQAVKRLFPETRLGIGPAIDTGFYYDFEPTTLWTSDDLLTIEKEMHKIMKENLPIQKSIWTREQAVQYFTEHNEPYKVELIQELPADEPITIFQQGEFLDLCRGPHLETTGQVRFFTLLSLAGAYWRGDEHNPMLQRIYGTAFFSKEDLEAYLIQMEEAKRRDHNKIGRELEYFTTTSYIGQGLPIMMPNGAKVIQILQRFVEDEEEKRGYLLTKTPFMAKSDLYKISGHWQHYREGMFIIGDETKDEEVLALRPMTCPFQFQVFLAKTRSYRDLPMRLNETSTLFRNEASGEMHGLIRIRQFTISEGHIACTEEQLADEFAGCVTLANDLLEVIGLREDVTYQFSRFDPKKMDKYIGSPEQWIQVEEKMKNILDAMPFTYKDAPGEAAFYGPKLDLQMKNVFGKEDTLITVQIDFQLASRFEMEYTDAEGKRQFPYILHRTSIGCYERTLALLLEKYAGALPPWLAPVQVCLIPITDQQKEYAKEIHGILKNAGIRTWLDDRAETMQNKIRQAARQKIPYMLVMGGREASSLEKMVSVRQRNGVDLKTMPIAVFLEKLLAQIQTRDKNLLG
ncbi:threonine--tRNA ligase [bacterium]|nr:threonine--tRNA ligase [bacterium]